METTLNAVERGWTYTNKKKISKSKFYVLFKFPAYNSVFPNILLQHKNTKYVLSIQCLTGTLTGTLETCQASATQTRL